MVGWIVQITPICGRNLLPCDPNGLSDPYIKIKFAGTTGGQRTEVCHNTLNPSFPPKAFDMSCKSTDWKKEIIVSVWDQDRGSMDDFMGELRFPVGALTHICAGNPIVNAWFPLKERKRKAAQGEVLLQCELRTEEEEPIDLNDPNVRRLGIPPSIADEFSNIVRLDSLEGDRLFNEYRVRIHVQQARGLSAGGSVPQGTYFVVKSGATELARSIVQPKGESPMFNDNVQASLEFRYADLLLDKDIVIEIHNSIAAIGTVLKANLPGSVIAEAKVPLQTFVDRPAHQEWVKASKGTIKVAWNCTGKGLADLTPKRDTLIDHSSAGAGAGAGATSGSGTAISGETSRDGGSSSASKGNAEQSYPTSAAPVAGSLPSTASLPSTSSSAFDRVPSAERPVTTHCGDEPNHSHGVTKPKPTKLGTAGTETELPPWAHDPAPKPKKKSGIFGLFCGCTGEQTGGDDDAKY